MVSIEVSYLFNLILVFYFLFFFTVNFTSTGQCFWFYSLHHQLILQDQPERAVRILAKMKKLRVQPDIRTYELLFSLFGNVNAPYEEGNILSQVDAAKRIKAIEMNMATNRVQHSHLSMKNLVSPRILYFSPFM